MQYLDTKMLFIYSQSLPGPFQLQLYTVRWFSHNTVFSNMQSVPFLLVTFAGANFEERSGDRKSNEGSQSPDTKIGTREENSNPRHDGQSADSTKRKR